VKFFFFTINLNFYNRKEIIFEKLVQQAKGRVLSSTAKKKQKKDTNFTVECRFGMTSVHHGRKNLKKEERLLAKSSFKDGDTFCYCACVLRILGYLGFLRKLLPNTTVFLHGL